MPNPIEYKDLVGESVQSGFNDLITQLSRVQEGLKDVLQEVKTQATSLGSALSSIASATKEDKEAIAQYAAQADKLHTESEKLVKSLELVNQQVENASNTKGKDKKETINLAESYKSLSSLIAETGVNLEELLQTEKQKNIASKNGETANKALAGSYNQLYAQYNLVKNALNAMGKEMRNDINIGKIWEDKALSIMTTMKGMQEATGKHTLSVGDYGKALNGLSISTQQVLREMPTLANSLQQFFIAISNNVPIFVDNLKAVKEETGSWKIAMKGVLTSIFSWQTGLLVILTILPKIAKAIHDKKKAQEEANKATKEAISLTNLLSQAEDSASKAEIRNINELKTLYAISKDVARSDKERADALDLINTKYPEASQNVEAYISRLEQEARAKAYLNEIGNIAIKQFEIEGKLSIARANLEEKNREKSIASIEREKGAIQVINDETGTYALKQVLLESNYKKASKATEQAEQDIADLTKQYKDAGDAIDELISKINVSALRTAETSTKNKESLNKLKDYYFEYRESVINITKEGEEKDVELSQLGYLKKIEGYKDALNEIKGIGEKEKLQRDYLNTIIANLEEESGQKVVEIRAKYEEKRRKAEEKAIQERYKAEVKSADDSLKIAQNEATISNANIVRRNKALGEAEVAYWTERIRLAKEYGGEYLNSIELFESNLAKARFRAETGGESSGKATKKRTSGLLYSILYGAAENENKPVEELANFTSNLKNVANQTIGFINDIIDKRIELAEVAIEAAQKESEAAKTALDYEMEARANGYANNVEYARKEYEERLAMEKKAIAEKERLQKAQQAIDSATQLSSLITATANLLAGYSKIPVVGQALAIAAIASMWGTFAAAKITASQLTTYGDGMTEYLDYGGSHASGNDIDFGMDRNGKRRRVERGEVIGVVNKKNVDKYGADKVMGIITSLNNGTFDNLYGNTFYEKYGLAFNGMGSEGTNLSMVEKGIATLVEQGETKIVSTPNGRIEYRGNNKRIIRNS